MKPIARLATELRMSGGGQLAIGVGGLAAALAVDGRVGRALIPFGVALVVVGAASLLGSRWIRGAEPPEAREDVRVETPGLTARRTAVALSVPLLAVVLGVAFAGGLAAVLGGVVAAVGAVDLLNLARVRARERATGREIYRELGPSPFSSGRRPLYTRPT